MQRMLAWMLGNIGTSVGLVLINKILMKPPFNFSFVLTLTSLHFLMTSIGMELMAIVRMFDRKRLPFKETCLMTLTSVASIVLMNYSLRLNTIGFYQLSKLFGIPWLIAVQRLIYQKSIITTKNMLFSLALILIGLSIATVSDVRINLLGATTSIAGVIVATQFQIWQGDKQKQFDMNPLQINHAQALPTFVTCVIFAASIDGLKGKLFEHAWSGQECIFILISCLLALFFNLCTYGLLGQASPLTYQVVGHTKTVLILIGGYFLDPSQQSEHRWIGNLFGITITMLGVGLYTFCTVKKSVLTTSNEEVV